MNVPMSVLYMLKRFLSPVKKDPSLYWKALFRYSLSPINIIYWLIMIEQITISIETGNATRFMIYLSAWIAWFVTIRVILNSIMSWWWVAMSTHSNMNIYKDIVHKILTADNTAIEKLWTWQLIAVVEKGMETWNRSLEKVIQHGPSFVLMLLFTLIIIGSRSIVLLVAFLLVLAGSIYVSYYFNKKVITQRNISRDLRNSWTKRFVRIMMSKFEIVQHNNIDYEINKLTDITNETYESEKKRAFTTDMVFTIPKGWVFLMKFFIYGFVWYWILGETSTYADLVLFASTLSLLDNVIAIFINAFFEITKNFSQIEKLREVIDELPTIHNQENTTPFTYTQWVIDVQHVSFAYDTTPVLQNFSATFQAGHKIALVWPSGWGKSTLLKLLAWFIEPDSWTVNVDGQSLKQIDISTYYPHIWYLAQEPAIFDGTIYENILYGVDGEIDSWHVRHILRLAQCEFVFEFEDRLETQIGERGVRLSWGQKQRLAIAKIMLKNPDIILLDEPTSALDSRNEEKISQALHVLFEWKTVIIAAHRLQTVKEADEILVIEKWAIIERGTHDSLKDAWWTYAKMLELQTAF